jgi:hypothetical protein
VASAGFGQYLRLAELQFTPRSGGQSGEKSCGGNGGGQLNGKSTD